MIQIGQTRKGECGVMALTRHGQVKEADHARGTVLRGRKSVHETILVGREVIGYESSGTNSAEGL